jgi:8-oxo-dGTP pyrophosphatase MutT (NUDIX family)
VAALVLRRGRLLAVRRPPGGLLGGLWELPGGEPARGEDLERALVRALRERVGLEVRELEPAGSLVHVFSHRRLRMQLYRCGAVRGRVRLEGFDRHRWVSPAEAPSVSQSALMRRALALAWPAGGTT